MYEAKLVFPKELWGVGGGGSSKPRKTQSGGMDILWNDISM